MKTRITTTMMTMATVSAIAIGSSAMAGTVFNTTTNDLGSSQYQLVSTFTLNFDLSTAYVDSDLNGTVDSSFATGYTNDYDGFYVDPENYILDFSGDTYYLGNQLTTSGTVDWSLNYASTPGDASTTYSTILFGTMTGNILTVRDGVEWPVSGGGAGAGNRWGYALGDFDSFIWDSANGTLAAYDVAPGPFGMLAFAGFGMARRRRNR
jgi:MYXO-CTERM domain-containing protein